MALIGMNSMKFHRRTRYTVLGVVVMLTLSLVLPVSPVFAAYGGGGSSSSVSKSMFNSVQKTSTKANADSPKTQEEHNAADKEKLTKTSNTTKGEVYIDSNKNGNKDVNEVSLSSAVVTITINGGAVIDTTVTKNDGSYSFEGLAPGKYTITIIVPSGTFDTDQNQSDTDSALMGLMHLFIGSVHAQSAAMEYTFEIEVLDDGTVVQIQSAVGVTSSGVNANSTSVVTAVLEGEERDEQIEPSTQEQPQTPTSVEVPVFEPSLPAPRSSIEEILAAIDIQLYEQQILKNRATNREHGAAGTQDITLPDSLPNTGGQ